MLERRLWIAMMLVTTLSLAGGSAWAADNVQVSVDGAPISFVQPILMWDMLFPLLPAEPYLQALGATVTWDADAGQLIADLPGVHLEMSVGRNWMMVNGQRENVEYGLQMFNDIPYLPGPALARLLGFEVQWDVDTLSLAITSPVALEAETEMTATLLAPPGEGVPVVLIVRDRDSGAVREVPLEQRASITRARVGESPVPAGVDDLQPGDLLELGLTRQAVAVTVRASYAQQLGTIAAIQGNQLQLDGVGGFPLGEGVTAIGSDGNALHILGTVGEAAILRLSPETNEVWGIFSQRRGNPEPPATPDPIIAGFFVMRYDGPLTTGDTLSLRLLASAGGNASVTLPWRGVRITLEETAPGVYTADYVIPEEMEIAGTRLIARLALPTGRSTQAQSNVEVMVDTLPPRIYNTTPPPDSVVEPVQPRITASFQDRGPSGIDPESVSIRLDGRDASPRAQVTATGLVRIPERLAPGSHTVSIEVSDRAGNTAVETWSFQVGAAGPQILGVEHDAAEPLQAGDTITVTVRVAAPGRRAVFDIGEVVQGVAMQLQPDTNTYTGTYTVRDADRAENAPVIVHFTDAGGVVHDATAEVAVTIVPPQEAAEFAITTPQDGQRTDRRIVPAGTGPAGSRVRWIITYRKLILGGEVARGEATVADDGTWQAEEEIDLKLPLLGMADEYALSAQLLGEDGTVVDDKEVRFTAADQ